MDDERIHILLSHGRSLFREALRTVLDSEHDLRVVGEATNAQDAVRTAERFRPHVALIEAALDGGGVEVTERLRAAVPECRSIMLGDGEDQALLIRALEAGASGYLTNECALTDFVESTRTVHRGEIVIPPRMLGGLLAHLIRQRRERDGALRLLGRLTRREREVLALLTRGANNQLIAEELVISPETARTHVHNLMTKLDVHTRLQAAAFVVKNGLLDEVVGAGR